MYLTNASICFALCSLVYGAEPRILQQAPGGRENAKMIGKQIFGNFSLPQSDGNYFLRPDRILGAFLLDPANPIVGGGDEASKEAMAAEKARDATVKEALGQVQEKMKQHRGAVEGVQKKNDVEGDPGEEQRRFSDRTSFLMDRLASFNKSNGGQRQKVGEKTKDEGRKEGGKGLGSAHSPIYLLANFSYLTLSLTYSLDPPTCSYSKVHESPGGKGEFGGETSVAQPGSAGDTGAGGGLMQSHESQSMEKPYHVPGKDWASPSVVSSMARATRGGEGGASEGAVQSVDEVSEEGGGDRVAAWKMHVDAASGTPYWHNVDTNETTWERPGSEINLI